jgi:hypothetical protein
MQSEKMGFSTEEAKPLVAATQATLQREREEQAMRAAANQILADEVNAMEINANEIPDPPNISTTQPSIEDMSQTNNTVLSEMLGEVIFVTHIYCSLLIPNMNA